MKNQTSTVLLRSALCLALLAAAAQAAPQRHPRVSTVPLAVPKRAKIVQASRKKVYVSATRTKSAPASAATDRWKLLPRIEDRGREETNYGFLLKRSF